MIPRKRKKIKVQPYATIMRMVRTISRGTLERRLGGTWYEITEAPERRTNGQLVTYTGPSKVVQGRMDKFVMKLEEGSRILSGRSWADLARMIGV